MKRVIAAGVVLLLAAIGVFLWPQNQTSASASQIAPSDCLVYVELPNLVQTAKRWPDTALCQILAEPSVRRFLNQPLSAAPKGYQRAWESFKSLRCSAAFFGATDPNRENCIFGFQTSVGQSVRRREIGNLSKSLFSRDVQEVVLDRHRQAQSDPGKGGQGAAGIYFAQVGSWIFLSRSTDLLNDAIRNANAASGGLQSLKLFQECRSHVQEGYDILCFVQGGPSLDLSSGLLWRFRQDETQGATRAVLATTAIDGARLRDTIFTRTDTPANASRLDRQGLAMTSPQAVGYLASRVGLSEIWRWCDKLSEDSPIAETIRDHMGEMKSFGIDPRDLDSLVSGAEVVVDRELNPDSLNVVVSLRVTDPEKFQHLIDRVVTERFPDRCTKSDLAGVPAYLMRMNEGASIVFGLVGRQLLIAWSRPVFAEAVRRLQNRNPGLEKSEQFKATESLVDEPDDLFVYVDSKACFERFYDASRPMLIFGVALIPGLNQYIDAMALPKTAEISKHLNPIVLSRRRVAHGVIDESAGPVTAYEASVFLLGGAAAMGLLQHQ